MDNLENEGELRFTELLEQIRICLKNDFLSVAIMTSLAIPDIAGAINSKNGKANKTKYACWFNEFCKPKFQFSGGFCLNGDDCYYLRCSVLHQGKAEHQKLSAFSDIILCRIPQASDTGSPISLIKDDILLIEPKFFCNRMISAAYDWLDEVHGSQNFKNNSKKFLKLFSLKFDGVSA